MLNFQQVQALKSAGSAPGTGIVNKSAPLDDESFSNWSKPHTDISTSVLTPEEQAQENDNRDLGGEIKGFGSDVMGHVNNIADEFKKGFTDGKKGVMGPGDALVGGTKIASEATSVIGDAFKHGIGALTDIISNSPDVQQLAKSKGITWLLDTVKGASEEAGIISKPVRDALSAWATAHPKVASVLQSTANAAGNLAAIELPEKAAGITSDVAGQAGKVVGPLADNVAESVMDAGGILKQDLKNAGSTIKDKIMPQANPEGITGQILQGKTKDIESGTSGLASLDKSKIKTYEDLTNASTNKIGELAKKQDAEFAKDPTPRPLESFEKTVGEGDNTVKTNYVKDALGNLKELYTGTSDAEGLVKINELISKSNKEGLTTQEVNNLARTYGSEFGSKAFGKINGEPLTGVNAQRFENTRTGLKNTARDLLPSDESRQLDAQMTDLYTVKDLSSKMAEKVNTLTQRLQKPNVFQKIGGLIGKATRITGIGDFASKLLGIDKVPGAATLNAVELESKLAKNIKKFDAAMGKDDTGFINDIVQMYKDAKASGTEGGMVKSPFVPGADKAHDFSSFHPDDKKFLTDFSSKVKNREQISQKEFDRVRETWEAQGYETPKTKTQMADLINQAEESSFHKTMDENSKK